MTKYLVPFFITMAAMPVFGQSLPLDNAYAYQYARPGHATMTVYIWGAVAMPGVWRVEPGVDLVELLTAVRLGGVGTAGPRERQRTLLQIYRKGPEGRSLVYEAWVSDLIAGERNLPELQDEDVLQIEPVRKRRISWRGVATALSTTASLLLVFFQLREFNR